MSIVIEADHGIIRCDARRCDQAVRIERGPYHEEDTVAWNLCETAHLLGWSVPESGEKNDRCPRHRGGRRAR
jgi:hypothetical protein